MTDVVYHRTDLARLYAQRILNVGVGSAASSGVFLAAPRRTGKSTFMREDLRPALENAGAIVLYADLWSDTTKDPGSLIVSAVREAVGRSEGVITRMARRAGMEKVAVGGFSFSLDKVGMGKDINLTDALTDLSDESGKIIVFLLDEAQHAITSDEGVAALFALKAARDELNSSKHHGFRIVCTGSNRNKLAMLRTSKEQAFFGATMVDFPTLDLEYIKWFCEFVELPAKLDPEVVFQVFTECGSRPELLAAAADKYRFDFAIDPLAITQLFIKEVRTLAEELNDSLKGVLISLTPIQSAVIRVMAAKGKKYAPFESATMAIYAKAMSLAGIPDADIKIDVTNVQQALIALQEKKLVWKASRGVYAIDEDIIVNLLRADGLLEGLDKPTDTGLSLR